MKLSDAVPSEARRPFIVDFTSGVASGLFIGMAMPFIGIEARRLGASPAWIASIAAAGPIGCLLSLYLADKVRQIGAVRSVALLIGGGRALLILMPLAGKIAPNGRGLVGLMFVSTVISALARPAYFGVMGRVYPNRCRAQVMGYVRIGVAAATVVGAIGGGRLIEMMDPHHYYALAGGIGVIGSLIFNRIAVDRRESLCPADMTFSARRFIAILRANRPYAKFLIFSTLCGFGNLLVLAIAPLFWRDMLKMSPSDISWFPAISAASGIITFFWVGAVIDRAKPLWLFSRLQLLLLVAPLGYVAAALLHSSIPLLPAFAAGGAVAAGFQLSLVRVMVALSRGREEATARYQGLWSAFFGVRGLVAPAVAVALLGAGGGPGDSSGYLLVFVAGLLCIAVGSILNIALAYRMRRIEARLAERERRNERRGHQAYDQEPPQARLTGDNSRR